MRTGNQEEKGDMTLNECLDWCSGIKKAETNPNIIYDALYYSVNAKTCYCSAKTSNFRAAKGYFAYRFKK